MLVGQIRGPLGEDVGTTDVPFLPDSVKAALQRVATTPQQQGAGGFGPAPTASASFWDRHGKTVLVGGGVIAAITLGFVLSR